MRTRPRARRAETEDVGSAVDRPVSAGCLPQQGEQNAPASIGSIRVIEWAAGAGVAQACRKPLLSPVENRPPEGRRASRYGLSVLFRKDRHPPAMPTRSPPTRRKSSWPRHGPPGLPAPAVPSAAVRPCGRSSPLPARLLRPLTRWWAPYSRPGRLYRPRPDSRQRTRPRMGEGPDWGRRMRALGSQGTERIPSGESAPRNGAPSSVLSPAQDVSKAERFTRSGSRRTIAHDLPASSAAQENRRS